MDFFNLLPKAIKKDIIGNVKTLIHRVYKNIITNFKERRNSYNKFIYIIRGKIMEHQIISQIFTMKNILIYLLCVNIFTFLIMWYDKHEAKIGQWRVREGFLFMLVFLRWRNWWNRRNVHI